MLISLYTTDTVEEVLGQLDGGLRPGQILIDTTTGEPEQTVRLGTRLAARGVRYLDAPISGSSEQTRRGEATAIVGGPQEAFAACRDLFDCCVQKTIYAGPCGSGSRMKLVSNLVLGLNRAALAEGLVFAQALGIDMVWFGVLMAINLQMAFISPPVGFSLFYLQSVAPREVATADIHKSALPFMALQMAVLILVAIFPQTVRWLIDLAG